MTEIITEDNDLLLQYLEKSESQCTFTLVEYSNEAVKSVKLKIELPDYGKLLDLETSNDVIIYDILETVSEHFTLDKRGAYLEFQGKRIPEYMDCRSLGIDDDLLTIKFASKL